MSDSLKTMLGSVVALLALPSQVDVRRGTWYATSRSVGIHTTTVAADDLHLSMIMVAEPVDQGVSGGILQQVDDAVSSGIHQNRAVAASAAKRKFVNPEHLWRLDGLLRERPYQTHQRGTARRHR